MTRGQSVRRALLALAVIAGSVGGSLRMSAQDDARRAGEAMLGAAGPLVLAVLVVLSVLASALALLIMAPRLYVAMSADGLFPSALARVNPLTRSPARATALLALLASVFVCIATFQEIVAFFMCTTLGFIALGQTMSLLLAGIDMSVGPLAGLLVVIASFHFSGGATAGSMLLGLAAKVTDDVPGDAVERVEVPGVEREHARVHQAQNPCDLARRHDYGRSRKPSNRAQSAGRQLGESGEVRQIRNDQGIAAERELT